jgi:hypothetical protein
MWLVYLTHVLGVMNLVMDVQETKILLPFADVCLHTWMQPILLAHIPTFFDAPLAHTASH